MVMNINLSQMQNFHTKFIAFFVLGLPEYGVAPFDPHKCKYVELRRGDDKNLGGYKLVLSDVSEYGWTRSKITDLK